MDHRRFGGEHECWNADRQGAHNGDIFDSTASQLGSLELRAVWRVAAGADIASNFA
jgi:hypothetical protein